MNALNNAFHTLSASIEGVGPYKTYEDITQAIIEICSLIRDEDEVDWAQEGEALFGLDDLIIGAYWHYANWHSGQASKGYEALSQIGTIFSPGMTQGPDPESMEQYVNHRLGEICLEEMLIKGDDFYSVEFSVKGASEYFVVSVHESSDSAHSNMCRMAFADEGKHDWRVSTFGRDGSVH